MSADSHIKLTGMLGSQLSVGFTGFDQPRSQVLFPFHRETLVGSGHVTPRIWDW